MKEIGRLCGVSIGTVDRALNGRPGVNTATKEKILNLAREYGYQPHLQARALVTGSTMTVGLVVFNVRNYFFGQLITAIDRYLRSNGYTVYPVFTERDRSTEEESLKRLAAFNVDGIILFPVGKGREYEQLLQSLGKPIVTVGNRVSKRWPFFGIDDLNAEMDAVRFVSTRGYEQAVFVAPPLSGRTDENVYEVEQRLKGFLQGARDHLQHAKPEVISSADYLEEALQAALRRSRKTAFLCTSDIYALRLLAHFRAAGLTVPGDVGLMGFDNIDLLQFVQPRLSTVDYHIGGIAEAAAKHLMSLVRDGAEKPLSSLIKHTIVPGESL